MSGRAHGNYFFCQEVEMQIKHIIVEKYNQKEELVRRLLLITNIPIIPTRGRNSSSSMPVCTQPEALPIL